jgi:hypothetical protein
VLTFSILAASFGCRRASIVLALAGAFMITFLSECRLTRRVLSGVIFPDAWAICVVGEMIVQIGKI